jgi:hypothetical protein
VVRSSPLVAFLLPRVQPNLARKAKHHREAVLGYRHCRHTAGVSQMKAAFACEHFCHVLVVAGTGELKKANLAFFEGQGRWPPKDDFSIQKRKSPISGFFGDEINNRPASQLADDPLALVPAESVDSNHYPFQHLLPSFRSRLP